MKEAEKDYFRCWANEKYCRRRDEGVGNDSLDMEDWARTRAACMEDSGEKRKVTKRIVFDLPRIRRLNDPIFLPYRPLDVPF